MATICFYIRSSKNTDLTSIRVRLSCCREKIAYAVTKYIIPVAAWDGKKGTIKKATKFDNDNFTFETAQSIVLGLIDIERIVIQSFNRTTKDNVSSEWLQNIVDGYYLNGAKMGHNDNEIVLKKIEKEPVVGKEMIKPLIEDVKIKSPEEPKQDMEVYERGGLNSYVSRYIEEADSGVRLTLKNKTKFEPGSVKVLKGFRSQFNLYQKTKNRTIDFDDVTMEFYKDFTQYFSVDKNYSLNTVGKMVQNLITFILAAYDDGLHNNLIVLNRKFKVDKNTPDNVYLKTDRLDVLFELSEALFPPKNEFTRKILSKWNLEDISDKTREAWSKALDVILVGSWTGQRFSDYSRINKDMIIDLDGQRFIKIFQQKPKKFVYVPLILRVESILNRRGGFLPIISDQKTNEYIKLICKQVGFTEIVTVVEKKGGKVTVLHKKFCDMVKTHTARRTFATNMQGAGADLASIAEITGHSSEAMLRRYLKLDAIEKAQLAAKSSFFQTI